jgi:predicted RNA-binding protein with PIN domain
MSWVIDGSNVLGRLGGGARESMTAKRELAKRLAQFGRTRRVRVACYFDGPEPEHFGKHLGGVMVIFSGKRTADDLIVQRVAEQSGWKVVTSDQTLAARVGGRRVEIVGAGDFLRMLDEIAREQQTGPSDEADWTAYFSDPKNRNVF